MKISSPRDDFTDNEARGLASRLVRALSLEKEDLAKRLKRAEIQLKSARDSRHCSDAGNQLTLWKKKHHNVLAKYGDQRLENIKEVVAVMEVLDAQPPTVSGKANKVSSQRDNTQ